MSNGTVVFFQTFQSFPDLVHGISTRAHASIKERGVIFHDNLQLFTRDLAINPTKMVFTKQVHGSDVAVVDRNSQMIIMDKDGLVTKERDMFIGMATADCLPIVFFDKKENIIGVAHAGYKGILKGIIENMITQIEALGGDSDNILVGIGPSIGPCCYNVPQDRVAAFAKKIKNKKMYSKKDGNFFLDLRIAATEILLQLGIKRKHIEVLDLCTNCHVDRFFSYRGSGKRPFGEFATIIGMR